MSPSSAPVVLFDLDGTVSDSAPGILRCLDATFDQYDLPRPSQDAMRALLGPPFWVTLPPYLDGLDVGEFIDAYRVHYVEGGGRFETTIYPGVRELLEGLRGRGRRLAVATSKAEPQVPSILEHLGVDDLFEVAAGDTPAGTRGGKAGVIAEALRRLIVDPAQTDVLMVGDREADVLGARAHGIDCLGAGWGYGEPDELEHAGAVSVHPDATSMAADPRLN